MGSESHLRRGSLRKTSSEPLGELLDALGTEKKSLESLLEPLGEVSGASWDALGIFWETSAGVLEAISELGMRL